MDPKSNGPSSAPANGVAQHPLSPLTGAEISQATNIIHSLYPAKTNLHFKAVTLQEPPKAQLIPFLDAVHYGQSLPSIERKAFVNYYIRNTVCLFPVGFFHECYQIATYNTLKLTFLKDKFHEAVINLINGRIESHLRLGPNVHGAVDGEEIAMVEKIALEDEGVKAEIAKLQLPQGTVLISDPWPYGIAAITL